jgi:hypothetical protein
MYLFRKLPTVHCMWYWSPQVSSKSTPNVLFPPKAIRNIPAYGHLQTVKWRLYLRSGELVATDVEQALHYIFYITSHYFTLHYIVTCYATKDAVRIGYPFITILNYT